MSGYTACACETCFEIAISSDTTKPAYCHECQEFNCKDYDTCQVPDIEFEKPSE